MKGRAAPERTVTIDGKPLSDAPCGAMAFHRGKSLVHIERNSREVLS